MKKKVRPIGREWKNIALNTFKSICETNHDMSFYAWFDSYVSGYWDDGMSAELAGQRAAEAFKRYRS